MQTEAQFKEKEKELVERAKTDQEAFVELYNFYFPKILGYVKKRVKHQETAEDLVSETFTKVFVNLEKFDFKGYPFSSWLYRIAVNVVIDYWRKENKIKTSDIDEHFDIASNMETDQTVIIEERHQEVVKYMEVLPERERQVVELKFFAELSNQEIAQTMKISANLVGVIIFRALKKMRKINT